MSGQPTVIYHAANPQQAHLLKSVLEDQGIAAWVVNESIQIAGGELPLGWTAAPQVVVGAFDAAEARVIAEEFDATTLHEPTADDGTDSESPAMWKDWPTCPDCHERRQARCPVCGSAGTDFPLADIDDEGNADRVLLICTACDDHFRPQQFRLCHRCGHDFGDGLEVAIATAHIHADDNRRVWLLMGGLIAGGLALAAYFAWITR